MLEIEQNYLPEEEIIPPQSKIDREKIPHLLLLIFLFFLISFTSLVAFSYFSNLNRGNPIIVSPPITPSSTPTPVLTQSIWATDSAVLEIENKTKEIQQSLDNLDLTEPNLSFPVIDFNLNFDKPK